ncbi:ribosome biogenesis GTPase YlqF [Desulfoplanes formicivorans]|uniref:Ribosome biogenesis GTPase A n=1 Tax=Desulfoplanes formicivorans TaxID=1592317 RepID=A0A194AE99_9BACT|nr:ribosome biogenesis GTPase YlqF [Desulfoplanes formicivorans]GAU07653.1 GTPase YlqF [Desulfoplanes formicivorans]
MDINWFPGHMHKARQAIARVMPSIDVVVEVLDARLPLSSQNPLLHELKGDRPCIRVLNKADMADPRITTEWIGYFQREKGVKALAMCAKNKKEAMKIIGLCKKMTPKRDYLFKPVRVMMAGIPNVGKSTLINTIVGREITKAANQAAITRKPKHIDLKNGVVLSDTPGILWPKLQDKHGAFLLAASGAIRDTAMSYPEVAMYTGNHLLGRYPDLLMQRYKLKELPADGLALLEAIGRKRGCLVRGGEVDLHKAAELFLRELKNGVIGHISLERPQER